MPFSPHTRLVCSGTYSNGGQDLEIWSWSVALRAANGQPNLPNAVTALVYDAAANFHADSRILASTSSALRVMKCNEVDPQGHYVPAQTNMRAVNIPGQGGGALAWPLQCAVVVSLETDLRGSSYRGRFYLPPMGGNAMITGAGRLSDTLRDPIAQAAREFLGNVINAGAVPIVASKKPANTVITGVRVGNVVDTLRTRRNSLLEAYKHVPVGAVGP